MTRKKQNSVARLTKWLAGKSFNLTPSSSPKAQEADEQAVRVLVVVLFLLPILFWPLTSEFYQTAKLALVGGAVAVLAAIAILPSVKDRVTIVPPTLLLPAVFVLMLIVGLGTFFSIDSTGSAFGQFSSPHGSLLSYILYFLLFFFAGIFLNTEPKIIRALKAWVVGSTLMAAVTILQYFNLYLFPMAYTRQRFWSPTGSPTFAAIYLAATIVVGVYLAQMAKAEKRLGWSILVVVQILALTLLGHPAAWLALAVGALVFLSFVGKEILTAGYRQVRLISLLGIAGAVLSRDSIRQVILPGDLARLPTEIILGWGSSWGAVTQVLSNRPLFGIGPETFGLIYPQIKTLMPLPVANININFPRAGVEIFQLLSGTGLVGLAAIGFLVVALLTTLKRKKSSYALTPFIAAAVTASFAAWFLAPAGVVTSAPLFIGLGILAVASRGGEQVVVVWPEIVVKLKGKIKEKRPLPVTVIISTQVLGIGIVILLLGRYLLADFHYRRAIDAFQAGNGDRALTAVDRAIRLSPSRDEYNVGAATINLALASNLSRQPEATDAASRTAQLINTFINRAVNQARRATALGPQRVGNWQNLGEVYRNLLTVLPGAGANAVAAYRQAIQLDPSNPLLPVSLGNILLNLNQPKEAISAFNSAIQIRANLPSAYLGLARAYRLDKNPTRAVQVYERLLKFKFDQESDTYKQVQREYEEAKMAAEAEGGGATAEGSQEEASQGIEVEGEGEPLLRGPGSQPQPLVPSEVEPVVPPGEEG